MRKTLFLCLIVGLLTACETQQRAADAATAKITLVGYSKEQIFTCMGIPDRKSSEGDTDIWLYRSGNKHEDKYKKSVSKSLFADLGFSDQSSETRFCQVNIVFNENRVKMVNYIGPSSGFLADDEQCGFAVKNCLAH